jgi:hypothetical protein
MRGTVVFAPVTRAHARLCITLVSDTSHSFYFVSLLNHACRQDTFALNEGHH